MQIHVYFEQVLFDNLLMDFSLLLCARVLSGRRQSLRQRSGQPGHTLRRGHRRDLRLPDARYRFS